MMNIMPAVWSAGLRAAEGMISLPLDVVPANVSEIGVRPGGAVDTGSEKLKALVRGQPDTPHRQRGGG
ncbi:hypothetical protein [Sinorhizobium mexicanum]|uniref:Uncharacterized protein n=1 Tax=Sinorhizobium mexicanum TaxID=375549 RepID=A0A859QH43_9HYPH|nr:hypothetical protein [Sinorhizobium mexicanum]MBP1884137.1 hypothetical protein [Sinorhizobium mexicanum]QLL64852.1 hypothetical protein FKV68_26015 [Sinorhizobium mexicanum]